MIHFDAKHQKSEARTKVKSAKLSKKIEAKRKWNEKIDKNVFFSPETKLGGKIMQKILNWSEIHRFSFMWSENFKAKITKSKQSEKFKAKKAKK